MIYTILGLVLGLVLFLCTIIAYTLGLKHGKQLSNNITPKLDINPIKAYKEHKEAKEEKIKDNKEEIYIKNFWNYDGTPQKPVEEGDK